MNKDYDGKIMINNLIIKNRINNDKLILNKKEKYNLYNDYIEVDKFADLFKSHVSYHRAGLRVNPNPTQNQPVSVQQTGTTSQLQGRVYDARGMWSPKSNAGTIYEWNRGVIGIAFNGSIAKEKLDGTDSHHADATVKIASSLGTPIDTTSAPFEAAINCANQGTLIFQSEGDNAFVYFPEIISKEQVSALTNEILPRDMFNFSFTHRGEIFEEQDYQSVINYANTIQVKENTAVR